MVKKKTRKKKTKRKSKESQADKENKILRNFLLGIVAIVLIFLLIFLFFTSQNRFSYNGVKFNIVREENLIFYHTSLPVIYEGEEDEYHFYIRNDPRVLEGEVDFNGTLYVRPTMVINSTGDFTCDGDGIIAIANMVNLYSVLGTHVIKDQNATCDPQRRYVYIKIQPGNETSIIQNPDNPTCYEFNVNNCEILEVTERFMIETFAEVNKFV